MKVWQRTTRLMGGLMVVLMGLAACFGGAEEQVLGSDVVFIPESQGTLVCSRECADRGQCGTLDNGQNAILMTSFGPEVRGHDVLAVEGADAVVLLMQDQQLSKVSDPNAQLTLHFYQVQIPEKPTAWVAGWCIQQPAP